MEQKFYITEEGLNDLKQELETLIHVTRNEVIEELKAARAQGDLSENADYDAARDHQARFGVEGDIAVSVIAGIRLLRIRRIITVILCGKVYRHRQCNQKEN